MTEHYLDRLARTIKENWNQPALTDFYLTEDGTAQDTSRGNHYTYGEMHKEILRLDKLFQALGLQKGDHIAICGANSAHWAIAYLAIAAYQGVAVTILHSQSPEDIAHQIDFSDAKTLFTDDGLWTELKDQSLPQVENIISLDNWRILCGKDIKITNYKLPITNHQFVHGFLDELAMICFTSGSTSSSKGIMLTYRSISNNVKNIIDGYPDEKPTIFMSVLPMAHVYGLLTELLAQLLMGEHVYLTKYNSLYELYKSIRVIKPYALRLIPFLVMALLRTFDNALLLLGQCKQIYIGGSFMNKDIEDSLLNARIPISIGYGMTESGPLISYSIISKYKRHSCGKIVEGMTAHIAPSGEILVKGENVMLGYYKDPEATARKIDKDGWLHTGDKGHLDEDGYLYVEGRLEQDMIVLPNGENIHPEDIERKINALPEVSESIVLARDGRLVAIVVPNYTIHHTPYTDDAALRRNILRTINPQLPLFSQLYDIEITDTPLQKTEKQTIKRYLYK